MTNDDFRLHHSGEIREALIMIEGENGGFELLKHGVLIPSGHRHPVPYAIVRSTESGRAYFLVRDANPAGPLWRHWHENASENLSCCEAIA